MDYDSSTKFISSLAKFLQSLCNGYVEFDNGVQVIGHLYLSVDTGKTIDYILNEKVCKTDENSVTFISNSFHAQPAERPKPPGKKTYEKDSKLEDTSENQTSNLEPRSTNFGTLPTRIAQNSPHSQNLKRAFSPSSKHIKDDGSPLKLGRSSPKHKKNRTESMDQNLSQTSNPASENSISSQPSPAADGIGASVSAQGTDVIHGSQYTDSYQQNFFQTGDEDNSVADESDERDIKPSIDTDVTFIKEEFAPSSCSQSGGQNRDRNHGEDSSAYYHSNQSFPASNFTSQAGFGGSVRSNFGSSADRSSLYTSGPASSQLEGENSGDPSVLSRSRHHQRFNYSCDICSAGFNYPQNLARHRRCSHGIGHHVYFCHTCCTSFSRKDVFKKHLQAQSHISKQNELIRLEEMSSENRRGLLNLPVVTN